ncbi:MAG TPA: PIN domain-containing protein [Candidatus Binatia bacterium]|nr:PIN domain-containing protein [Candidatus Binatia bacterium]
MTTFVDTSALYALLDRDADEHRQAAAAFDRLLDAERLVTHNYVVVEVEALARARLGMGATRDLLDRLLAPSRSRGSPGTSMPRASPRSSPLAVGSFPSSTASASR